MATALYHLSKIMRQNICAMSTFQ